MLLPSREAVPPFGEQFHRSLAHTLQGVCFDFQAAYRSLFDSNPFPRIAAHYGAMPAAFSISRFPKHSIHTPFLTSDI